MRTITIYALTLMIYVATTLPAFGQQAQPMVALDTSLGKIVLSLDAQAAPRTVANFLSYVDSGFYNDTIFHRVIRSFMIQGGGLTADMRKKQTGKPIPNEADNGLKNDTGTIAMARTSDPHSATSQFFINVADNDTLNHTAKSTRGWGYCVFGQVVEGMDVVRAIESVKTTFRAGRRDVPSKSVVIHKALRVSEGKQ